MTTWITLPPHIAAIAEAEGKQRRHLITRRDIGHRYQLTADPTLNDLTLNVQARSAEHALGVALDIPLPAYDGKADNERGDVGQYEVRSTTHLDGGLILHPDDLDDRTCYLIIVTKSDPPQYGIVGSIKIRDGKKAHYWRTNIRHPCWIVPQYALDPYNTPEPPQAECGICPGVMLPNDPPPHAVCLQWGWKPGDRIYGPPRRP